MTTQSWLRCVLGMCMLVVLSVASPACDRQADSGIKPGSMPSEMALANLPAQPGPKDIARLVMLACEDVVKAGHQRPLIRRAGRIMVDFAAHETITQRYLQQFPNPEQAIDDDPDKPVKEVTTYWPAVVSYYVGGFEYERMRVVATIGAEDTTAIVFMPVHNTPNARAATLQIEMVNEPIDGEDAWRVASVRFAPPGSADTVNNAVIVTPDAAEKADLVPTTQP